MTERQQDRDINKWVKDRHRDRLGAREMESESAGPETESETERKDKRERQEHAHVTPLI